MQTSKSLECLLYLKHSFLPKLLFTEVMGAVHICGNCKGVEGLCLCSKMENCGEEEELA